MTGVIDELVDIDSEQAVIGSILVSPDLIAKVSATLPADAFGDGRYRFVYQAMLRLWERRSPANTTNTLAELREMGMRDETRGMVHLSECVSAGSSWYYVEHYAENILRMARRRTLMNRSADLARAACAAGEEPNVEELARSVITDVRRFDPVATDPENVAGMVDSVVTDAVATWQGQLVERVTSTGMRSLDRLTAGGIRPEEMWVLAARPSMGKTAMALRIAASQPSVFFSLEMPKRRLIQRLIATQAGVRFDTPLSPIGDINDQAKWMEAADDVRSLPIAIYDQRDLRGATTTTMEGVIEREMAERGAEIVFIDHLGYVSDQYGKSLYERTSEITRRIKQLATSTGAGIVLLSQLNREVEARPGCRPQLSDLRESGRIEEDADVVMMLYRRQYYVSKGMINSDVALDYVPMSNLDRVELSIQKNRNGETTILHLGWEANAMKFHEVAA